MPAKIHKAIITNRAALDRKYGSGIQRINQAIARLVAADRERGINTAVFDLADRAGMAKLQAKPVTRASDPKQYKSAIDRLYRKLTPDYLLILGSIDVVPHQNLNNPLFDANDPFGDPDRFAWSDLPYSCDRPYGQNIEDFIGPTRVVGRLPDVTGGDDPAYLTNLLTVSADYRSAPRSA